MLRKTAYTLFGIIAALLLTAKLLPRWLGRNRLLTKGKLIEVVEFQRLEPRKGIYLIRVAGQYLLVGSSNDGLQTLAGGPLEQEKIAAMLTPQSTNPSASLGSTGEVVADGGKPEPRQFIEVLRGKRGDGEIG